MELKELINKIHEGDCRELLKQIPDESVNCVVTSPPYFGLRDYGTAKWEGGEVGCNHEKVSASVIEKSKSTSTIQNHENNGNKLQNVYRDICGKCGATRIDKQIGLEETPDEYVFRLVEVFNEVKRILKNDGTIWLNLGDSYNQQGGPQNLNKISPNRDGGSNTQNGGNNRKLVSGLKSKDLIGIPWMVAFALRSAGWYLRQDIIWHKPNPMPESVTDRCTKSHEYIFLLSKADRYYFDHESIKQPLAFGSVLRLDQNIQEQNGSSRVPGKTNGNMKVVGKLRPHGIVRDRLLDYDSKEKELRPNVNRGEFENESDLPGPHEKANKKSVWTVTTKPFSEAHFATFPQDLIVDCIKAGSRENDIILDPFIGAGTTAVVAKKLNRNFIGIELNPEYIKIAEKRLRKEIGLFL